jgi:hypothetical protein
MGAGQSAERRSSVAKQLRKSSASSPAGSSTLFSPPSRKGSAAQPEEEATEEATSIAPDVTGVEGAEQPPAQEPTASQDAGASAQPEPPPMGAWGSLTSLFGGGRRSSAADTAASTERVSEDTTLSRIRRSSMKLVADVGASLGLTSDASDKKQASKGKKGKGKGKGKKKEKWPPPTEARLVKAAEFEAACGSLKLQVAKSKKKIEAAFAEMCPEPDAPGVEVGAPFEAFAHYVLRDKLTSSGRRVHDLFLDFFDRSEGQSGDEELRIDLPRFRRARKLWLPESWMVTDAQLNAVFLSVSHNEKEIAGAVFEKWLHHRGSVVIPWVDMPMARGLEVLNHQARSPSLAPCSPPLITPPPSLCSLEAP